MDDKDIRELEIQKSIAYSSGILQGDITIKRLLESIAEGVIIVNELGRIILINSRFTEMSGYSNLEVMGKDMNIFIISEMHKTHKKHLDNFFENPRIRPMGIGMELTIIRKDRTTFPVEISISFLDSESGKLGIGFITDNTERKKAIDELTRRNIELDAYAHTVAHDLQSSLNGINGFSELLLDKDLNLDKKDSHKYIEIIAKGSQKMTKVIRELLLFASIDKNDIKLIRFSMKEVINGACARLKYQIDQREATIRINKNIIDCKSYPAWIEEVWFNYISNAVKYGGDKPQITITSQSAQNGFIKFSVIDKGPGLSKKLVKSIFEENNRPIIVNSDKGSGFGLSIVKRIIDKLDGFVSVDSKPSGGCEFSFYLKK